MSILVELRDAQKQINLFLSA